MNPFKKIFRPATKASDPSAAEQPEDSSAPESNVPAESDVSETSGDSASAPAEGVPADPAQDPDKIRVFDPEGREHFMPREQFRAEVLLPQIEKVWEDADQLYATIAHALMEGFSADLLDAAEQLHRIDTIPERGAVILAVVYRELKRLDDSEQVLRTQIEQHGESPVTLVNLAKLQLDRDEADEAVKTLEQALELDPNQPDGIQWYCGIINDRDGKEAALEALRRLAAKPGSWRAQVWLAAEAIGREQYDEAKPLYLDAIAKAGTPVPSDLLVQISGDLGNAKQLDLLLELVGPKFDAATHGLTVGDNLLRACFESGRGNAFYGLLDLLYAQRRPDWRARLDNWDMTMARARASFAAKEAEKSGVKPTVAMIVDDGPAWLPEGGLGADAFPKPAEDAPSIAFIGCTALVDQDELKKAPSLGDAANRFSRAFPLFLAEQVQLAGGARVRPMVPWVQAELPAFMISNTPWKDEEVAKHARSIQPPCGYGVAIHLDLTCDPWRADLRLVRAEDGSVLGTASAEFKPETVETALASLVDQLFALLAEHVGLARTDVPSLYTLPQGPAFGLYLLSLEQLLSLRCNTLPKGKGMISGERGVIDGLIRLCLAEPTNLLPRLVLVQFLRRLAHVRPPVVLEYREAMQRLQTEKPLSEEAAAIVDQMLAELYRPAPPPNMSTQTVG